MSTVQTQHQKKKKKKEKENLPEKGCKIKELSDVRRHRIRKINTYISNKACTACHKTIRIDYGRRASGRGRS